MYFTCVRYTITCSLYLINFPTYHLTLADQVISLFSVYFLLVKPFYLALCLLRRSYSTLVTDCVYAYLSSAPIIFRYFKWLPSPFLWWPERTARTKLATFGVILCLICFCIWKSWEFTVKFELLTWCFHPKIKLSKWTRSFWKIGMSVVRKKTTSSCVLLETELALPTLGKRTTISLWTSDIRTTRWAETAWDLDAQPANNKSRASFYIQISVLWWNDVSSKAKKKNKSLLWEHLGSDVLDIVSFSGCGYFA